MISNKILKNIFLAFLLSFVLSACATQTKKVDSQMQGDVYTGTDTVEYLATCLLYTSPSPRDLYRSRMPSSA